MTDLLWAFPLIMFASIVVGWAAEVAAVHISAGLALAILAMMQTLPEFGVEAFISWSGNKSLMLANLTGSLRLFVGFGWPIVFFIFAATSYFRVSSRPKKIPLEIQMPQTFAVEATFIWAPLFYFSYIAQKNEITIFDGIVLCCFYGLYLLLLNFQRLVQSKRARDEEQFQEEEQEDHDLDYVPAKILQLKKPQQLLAFNALFLVGGGILYLVVHPFVEGLKSAALAIGMSEFVFIQWVAPFASEMPEKITAFSWATKAKKVPLAIFNMVSSSVNQWTLLAGMVPIVYFMGPHRNGPIIFDQFQHTELVLTIAQSALGALFLADLRFSLFEAVGLFVLWLIQFFKSELREEMIAVYAVWIGITLIQMLAKGRIPQAWGQFLKMFKRGLNKKA